MFCLFWMNELSLMVMNGREEIKTHVTCKPRIPPTPAETQLNQSSGTSYQLSLAPGTCAMALLSDVNSLSTRIHISQAGWGAICNCRNHCSQEKKKNMNPLILVKSFCNEVISRGLSWAQDSSEGWGVTTPHCNIALKEIPGNLASRSVSSRFIKPTLVLLSIFVDEKHDLPLCCSKWGHGLMWPRTKIPGE